jgi:prepilin-type N-terminal cleavage/methylation domain-containing protein
MKVSNDYRNEKGFTLIELLIVIAIIGILASIAIPTFAHYKNSASNAAVISDLRNAATAQEAYYLDNDTYASERASLEASPYDLQISVNVDVTVISANFVGYEMTGVSSNSGRVYTLTGPGGHITH